MDVILPGGLWESGQRQRQARFRTVDGLVELELAEAVAAAANVPDAVTRLLAVALERLGDGPPTPERVASLCVADRKQLMRLLDARLGGEARWHSARCRKCDAPFDFPLRLSSLPVGEAGEGYPFARVCHAQAEWILRLPNGADQAAVADIEALPRARAVLLGRILVEGSPDSVPQTIEDEAFWSRIETALEAVAPALIERVRATCPECGAENVIEPEPYPLLRRDGSRLLLDVHRLAGYYHWSETEILALPRHRRQRYLDLIDAARGMLS